MLRPLVRDIQVHRLKTRGTQEVPRPRDRDTLEEPHPQGKDTLVRDHLQVAAMVAPRPLARGTVEVHRLLDSTAATQRPLASSTAGAGVTHRGRGAGWTPRCSSGSARWTRTGAAR